MVLPKDLNSIIKPDTPIYAIAPHSDDVIWSLGGWLKKLADNDYDITLLTVFSQSIFVYSEMQAPIEASAIRQAEDSAAAQAAGIKRVHFLDFPEAPLREIPLTDIFDGDYKAPGYFLDLLVDALRRQVPADAVILAPTGFGEHVDHLTARAAAMRLSQPLVFYSDMPYAARSGHTERVNSFLRKSCTPVTIKLDTQAINTHEALFWAYHSQAAKEGIDTIRTHLQEHGLTLWVFVR